MEDDRSSKERILRENGTRNPRPESVCDPLFQEREFFDARDLVQVKYEMLRRVRVENWPVTAAARLFGFSRVAFYQTQTVFQQAGLPGLAPKRRGPRHAHKVTAAVLELIDQWRAADSNLRAPELASLIRKRMGLSIHPRSIERALTRREKKGR